MNNEIKVGDRVRVSKDAPKIYTSDWVDEMFNLVLKVTKVEDGNAMVVFAKRTLYKTVLTTIPCKYLIKVDAEAKEAKFKVGDKVVRKNVSTVRTIISIDYVDDNEDPAYYYNTVDSQGNNPMDFVESDLILYTEPTAPTIKVGDRVCCYNALHLKGSKKEDCMGYVTSITDMGITIQLDKGGLVLVYHESDLELVQPKEQTEAEKTNPDNLKKIAEEWANEVSNAIEEYGDAMCKIHIEAQNEAYWEAYTADLAKEIALKVANKYSDPKEAAEYAVSVAKAVVENLKKK
jgi:hypothetical protein